MVTELHIKLNPKASANKVLYDQPDMFSNVRIMKMSVTAVPENGKANRAMIDLLAQHFKSPKSAFTIVRGEISRNKVIKYQV